MRKMSKWKIAGIVFAVLLVIGMFSGGNDDKKEEPKPNESSETANETAKEETPEALTIKLNAEDMGEYGKEITLNEGTEFADTVIAFYVPVGKYEVTNDGEYTTQVNVYGDNIQKNEDGWEEFEMGSVVLVDSGKSAEIEVKENQFIHIDEPSEITLVQK